MAVNWMEKESDWLMKVRLAQEVDLDRPEDHEADQDHIHVLEVGQGHVVVDHHEGDQEVILAQNRDPHVNLGLDPHASHVVDLHENLEADLHENPEADLHENHTADLGVGREVKADPEAGHAQDLKADPDRRNDVITKDNHNGV